MSISLVNPNHGAVVTNDRSLPSSVDLLPERATPLITNTQHRHRTPSTPVGVAVVLAVGVAVLAGVEAGVWVVAARVVAADVALRNTQELTQSGQMASLLSKE
jgi:hypothetical protein